MINVAVFGYGYWGPNLVRNFFSAGANVKYVVDTNESCLSKVKSTYPSITVTNNSEDVISDGSVDAVVIAVPVGMHYSIARQALLAGKHVLIEKPMTDSIKTSEELIELAAKNNRILMCDHTFLYTGTVKKIHELVQSGNLGTLQYFDSVRINLGLFQNDVNVIWDLAPHDISILLYVMNEMPVSVVAVGLSHTSSGIEDIAYLTMNYQSNFIAHISVSWISPVKIRTMLLGGEKKMLVYNDIEPSEKVKIYDSGYGVTSHEQQNLSKIDYRTGDIYIPKLDNTEALKGMAQDFINAVVKGTTPVSNSQIGLNVIKILQAAEQSIKSRGKEVRL